MRRAGPERRECDPGGERASTNAAAVSPREPSLRVERPEPGEGRDGQRTQACGAVERAPVVAPVARSRTASTRIGPSRGRGTASVPSGGAGPAAGRVPGHGDAAVVRGVASYDHAQTMGATLAPLIATETARALKGALSRARAGGGDRGSTSAANVARSSSRNIAGELAGLRVVRRRVGPGRARVEQRARRRRARRPEPRSRRPGPCGTHAVELARRARRKKRARRLDRHAVPSPNGPPVQPVFTSQTVAPCSSSFSRACARTRPAAAAGTARRSRSRRSAAAP